MRVGDHADRVARGLGAAPQGLPHLTRSPAWARPNEPGRGQQDDGGAEVERAQVLTASDRDRGRESDPRRPRPRPSKLSSIRPTLVAPTITSAIGPKPCRRDEPRPAG
jgi:hypothetical protein